MKLNTEEFLQDITSNFKNVKIGSYGETEKDREDYFDEAVNIAEIQKTIKEWCNKFNDGIITLSELIRRVGNINARWDIDFLKKFFDNVVIVKSDTEKLKDSVFDLNNKVLKHIDCNGIKKI